MEKMIKQETESLLRNSQGSLWKKLTFVCVFLCWGTVGLFLVRILLGLFGIEMPKWFLFLLPTLIAALVGYVTNWLAITMLFEPYVKTRRHYISIITFGLWQQGLVPAKKNEIAITLGDQIENRLLNPKQIADEFCSVVSDLIDNKVLAQKLEVGARTLIHDHEEQIIDFLYPFAVQTLFHALDDLTTPEQIDKYMENYVFPWLQKESTRQYIADALASFGRERTGQIVDFLKEELRKYFVQFLSDKPLLRAVLPDRVVNNLIDFISWDQLELKIYDKINNQQTQEVLKKEILNFVNQFRDRMKKEEGRQKLDELIATMNGSLKNWLRQYLQTFLPKLVSSLIDSESLWNWIHGQLQTSAKPKIEEWVRLNGKDLIIEKLRIAQRVRKEIDRQDIKDFHEMINFVIAEHLGAIQVLGYVLGALVGALQTLVTCFFG